MLFLFFDELEGSRIDAIAFPGGGRSISKNMSQVGRTPGTEDFCAYHAETKIMFLNDIYLCYRFIVARPTRPGMKFGHIAEQVGPAADTLKDARLGNFIKRAGKRSLGALLCRHPVLLRC